jgi:hypothetical protein
MTAGCADKDLFHRLGGAVVRLKAFQPQFTAASIASGGGRRLDECAHLISVGTDKASDAGIKRRKGTMVPEQSRCIAGVMMRFATAG